MLLTCPSVSVCMHTGVPEKALSDRLAVKFSDTNQYPDRWISVRSAPVCVLIVLEVLMAVVQSV